MTKSQFAIYIAQRLTAIHSESFDEWKKEIGYKEENFDVTKMRNEKAWGLENYNNGLSTARSLVMKIAQEIQAIEDDNNE